MLLFTIHSHVNFTVIITFFATLTPTRHFFLTYYLSSIKHELCSELTMHYISFTFSSLSLPFQAPVHRLSIYFFLPSLLLRTLTDAITIFKPLSWRNQQTFIIFIYLSITSSCFEGALNYNVMNTLMYSYQYIISSSLFVVGLWSAGGSARAHTHQALHKPTTNKEEDTSLFVVGVM